MSSCLLIVEVWFQEGIHPYSYSLQPINIYQNCFCIQPNVLNFHAFLQQIKSLNVPPIYCRRVDKYVGAVAVWRQSCGIFYGELMHCGWIFCRYFVNILWIFCSVNSYPRNISASMENLADISERQVPPNEQEDQ